MRKLFFTAILSFVVQFAFGQSDSTLNVEKIVFTIVEVMPSWIGCETEENEVKKSNCTYKKVEEFIVKNLIYPENSKQNKLEGIAYTGFTVDEEGNIINPRVIRGINPELNEEAIRVIKLMPAWNPGTNNGIPVPVNITQPFKFSSNNSK